MKIEYELKKFCSLDDTHFLEKSMIFKLTTDIYKFAPVLCVYGLLKWSLDSHTDTTVCAVLYFPGSVHIYYKYLSLVTLISVSNQQPATENANYEMLHFCPYILGQADREGWTNEGSSYFSFYFHYGELSMHVKIPAT